MPFSGEIIPYKPMACFGIYLGLDFIVKYSLNIWEGDLISDILHMISIKVNSFSIL
jgi:hypothetical protein